MSKDNCVPLDLQPDSSTIVVAYRKYSISTRNSSYKKRVTWFNSEPVIATAIVEYIGEYVPSVVHGNAQHTCTTVPYRSLTSHQKSILRDGIQHGKAPREIRRDINTATPDDIISNRVAQNARYYQHKKDGPESTHRLNVADDVHSVLNMFQNSPFIREVITTCSSKPPSIILYTDLQMAMLKSAIASYWHRPNF